MHFQIEETFLVAVAQDATCLQNLTENVNDLFLEPRNRQMSHHDISGDVADKVFK